ncbi:M57 family metalloprotease [Paraflavisolibacter sp. H34]|uniref:M57 family metalloprotease n=1 Tax=Huijunlia imazamoxiresistens TaxID=3127457 RepID=UPI003016A211
MKKTLLLLAVGCGLSLFLAQCKKETKNPAPEVTETVLSQIKSLGFSTQNVHATDEGYLVEGDILLTPDLLNSAPSSSPTLRVANSEQYRTTYLVTGLPRTITVGTSSLGQAYIDGAKLAIGRFNALNLQLKFQFVTSGKPTINIRGFNQPPSGGYITLGSAGFPSSKGDPYREIKMNTNQYAYGSNPDVNYVGSVIQHELGHCIGFRHTDYMNRAYSCGGSASNEGASSVGAILIPGTPSGPDANSWMLACSNGGDRTFNSNDIEALNFLY